MFANEKSEESHHIYGIVGVKRFFQWILGCTYAKKTLRTRVAKMFHFAEAPHIVVYERNEERPWYWMVGIITAVLIVVLSLYYTVEAGFRSIRKFMLSVLHDPVQSTVSTPRCLSPTTPSSKKTSPQIPRTPEVTRQKVAMNEPVNCVFIRPANHKLVAGGPVSVPNLNSEEDVSVDPDQIVAQKKQKEEKEKLKEKEKADKKKSPPTLRLDEVQFDASSNFNIIPTMVPSPQVKTPTSQSSKKSIGSDRKSTGSESPETAKTSNSECDQVNEWVMKQIAGCKELEAERENAGLDVCPSTQELNEVSKGFMETIQQLIESHLAQSSVMQTSSNENLSEMSIVESLVPSLIEIIPSQEEMTTGVSMGECSARQTTGNDADIIVEDNSIFTDSENECSGSILVKGGTQKVLFRWKDDRPETVDSVTLTGSFFGWKMNIPMKRCEDSYEVCFELPQGMHDYSINIFRFD